jgi:predicted neutral ceramidase superfamily lipid hydrolase
MAELLISIMFFALCPFFKTLPQLLILVFTPSLYSFLIHIFFFRKDRVLTFRRLLALQLVQEMLHLSLLLAGSILLFLLPLEPCSILFLLTAFGVAASSFISILVLLGFCRRSVPVAFGLSLLHIILQSSRWLILSLILSGNWIYIVSALASAFSAGIFFLTALRLKQGGIAPPLKIFQAYLDYYFNGDESSLETMLEEMSEKNSLRFSLINLISENKPPLTVVGVAMHFGPFGTIGSSPLPSYLVKELEKNDRNIVILRFLSNHSLNLPSKNGVKKIGRAILEALNSAISIGECTASFFQKESEGYCITALRVGPYCIVFLSCPGYSSEDLPPEWLLEFSKIINEHGLTPLLISDAHNSIDSSSWKIFEPDENRFASLLEEAMEYLSQAPQDFLKIGFNRLRPKSLPEDEIGPGGISTLVFNISSRSHAIIVIDGNNMVKGLRDYLVNSLKSQLGLSALEVVTTDTHLLTGLKQARKGYFPIGFKTGRELLLETCRESLNKAVRSLSPCLAEAYVGEIKEIEVTGGLFNELEKLVEYSEKTILFSIMLLVFLTGLLILVL